MSERRLWVVYIFILVILILVLVALYEYTRSDCALCIDDENAKIRMLSICQTYGMLSLPALDFIDKCHEVSKELSRSSKGDWQKIMKCMKCSVVFSADRIGCPVVEKCRRVRHTVTVTYTLIVPGANCLVRYEYSGVARDPQVQHCDAHVISGLMRVARWYGGEVDKLIHGKYRVEARSCEDDHDYACCDCPHLDVWCGRVNDHCMHIVEVS